MTTEVWAIVEAGIDDNKYNTSRTSTWELKLNKICESMLEEEKDQVLEDFCFNSEECAIYRRFFIGKPTKKFLKSIVESSGLKFVSL
jgi:hypothetical protein